ncbi:alpha/beta hydrolase [Tsukamurella sp. PLM1]|uniref:alpha/beta hydrolase n=1 Tax=Tsukamurella sp. PLM1 TaxID=2929795 RepID=UPI00204866EA|nr:alpha/beta hydrolase [Tsukamurella sp. PLM1]BDH59096.1 membrane protein [Tsukamurella sp. PLM1]
MTPTPDHSSADDSSPRMNRRGILRLAGIGAASAGLVGVAACSSAEPTGTAAPSGRAAATRAPSGDPTSAPATLPRPDTSLPAGDTSRGADNFYISERLDARAVTFRNQFGDRVSGNLFVPDDMNRGTRNPAIVVSHPMGAVKEQSANLYAQKLAEQGFVTLSIDLPYWGASEGETRNLVAPDNYAEGFNASVDYLRTLDYVDRERIGALGICGSGSWVISAAKIDPRIKAVGTVSMYDMGAANRFGLGHSVTLAQRRQMLDQAAAQRDAEFAGADLEYTSGTVHELTASSTPVEREFYDFYRTRRGAFTPDGATPRTTTHPTLTSNPRFLNYFPLEEIETISPRPMMIVTGENAHSREFAEDAYRRAAEPKELVLVPGAGHVDLYDRVELIPFDRLAAFYRRMAR